MQFISVYFPGLRMNIRYLRQPTSLSYQAHSSLTMNEKRMAEKMNTELPAAPKNNHQYKRLLEQYQTNAKSKNKFTNAMN